MDVIELRKKLGRLPSGAAFDKIVVRPSIDPRKDVEWIEDKREVIIYAPYSKGG